MVTNRRNFLKGLFATGAAALVMPPVPLPAPPPPSLPAVGLGALNVRTLRTLQEAYIQAVYFTDSPFLRVLRSGPPLPTINGGEKVAPPWYYAMPLSLSPSLSPSPICTTEK